MSTALKLYIGAVITAGGSVLGASLLRWTSSEPYYFAYLTLALLASLLKLRLPGMSRLPPRVQS